MRGREIAKASLDQHRTRLTSSMDEAVGAAALAGPDDVDQEATRSADIPRTKNGSKRRSGGRAKGQRIFANSMNGSLPREPTCKRPLQSGLSGLLGEAGEGHGRAPAR